MGYFSCLALLVTIDCITTFQRREEVKPYKPATPFLPVRFTVWYGQDHDNYVEENTKEGTAMLV